VESLCHKGQSGRIKTVYERLRHTLIDANGLFAITFESTSLRMKIGTVVFSSLMGICGTSAWMGRSSEGMAMGTRGADGLVLKDHSEFSLCDSPFTADQHQSGMDSREMAAGKLLFRSFSDLANPRSIARLNGDPPLTSGCESQLVSTLKMTCHDTEAERIGGMPFFPDQTKIADSFRSQHRSHPLLHQFSSSTASNGMRSVVIVHRLGRWCGEVEGDAW
jgi:hypothetical protein